MDNIKNDKTEEKEIKEKVSKIVKKDIERLLQDKEGRISSEGLGNERKEALPGGAEKEAFKKHGEDYDSRQSGRGYQRANSEKNFSSLKDLREKDKEERKEREKFQRKLSKINRQSVKDIRKNIKEKSRKIAERKKIVLKKKFKEKMKKKITMNAKEGKSITISLLFTIFLFIALLNDSVDIVVGIVGWAVSPTGVGLIILAVTEIIGDIIDIVTTIPLIIFSFYIGGTTKTGAKKTIKRVALYVGAFIIELVPLLNLFTTWFAVLLYDWYKVRKRATEAERMDE